MKLVIIRSGQDNTLMLTRVIDGRPTETAQVSKTDVESETMREVIEDFRVNGFPA
jgi:hypothetical protein